MATDVATFGVATRRWFEHAFGDPTPAQAGAWPAIARGEHVLVCAPTGSGKTLAAFLAGLDRLLGEERRPGSGPALLYLSPLKALNYDVERNLRSPLAGIRAMAAAAGEELRDVEVAVRTGDTPADARRRMARRPPDVLITTPESLFLILTSSQREMLRDVRTVIIDEVHAMAATKRGAHLALSLERLSALCHDEPQRIALSATQRPLEEVARFVGGNRDVTIVDAGIRKELDLEVRVPVEDLADLGYRQGTDAATPALESVQGATDGGARSIWPAIYPELLELVRAHRSTLIFVNSRRLAERLALRLNELADEPVARAHHGSLSREARSEIEEALKAGALPCLVATSSLELGIDMGAIDLVCQVESPGLGRTRPAARRSRRPPGGRALARAHLPEVPGRPPRVRGRRGAHGRGADRGDARPEEPARRPLAAARGRVLGGACRGRRSLRPRAARLPVPRPAPGPVRRGAGPARRALPVRRVRRAAAPSRVGPRRGHRASARRRDPDRDRERRDDPRPRALRRLPRGRLGARRRARRGDGLRGARGSGVPARSQLVADRGDHARPGPRLPRSRRAGRDPVLEGRSGRPAGGAGRSRRAAVPRARAAARRGGRAAARRAVRVRAAGRLEPRGVRARPGARDGRRPLRPDDRRRALPRRDRRLAPVHPVALRRPRPRALGARARRRAPPRHRPRRAGALVGRRHHRAPSRHGRRRPMRGSSRSTPRPSRTSSSASSAAPRCTARASARTPRARS